MSATIGIPSLLILLLTVGVASRCALTLLHPAIGGGRAVRAAAFGTVFVVWCLLVAHLLGALSEVFDASLVRMPLITAFSVVATSAMLVLCRLRPSVSPPPPVATVRHRPVGIAWIVCLVPVALLHGGLFITGMLRPTTSYDGLYYHLPLMMRWLREGRLAMASDIWKYSLPANSELWQTFFAATTLEPLIDLSMAPIGALLALIVFLIARELGGGRIGARLSALFALACPIVALQMYSSYTDLFGTTFLLGGLYWILRVARCTQRPERIACAVLAGLSVGVAIGTKFQFIAWTACLVLSASFVFVRQWLGRPVNRQGSARGARMPWPLAFVLAVPACSAFWYFRAFYHTGWPLYPIHVSIAGYVFGVGVPLADQMADIRLPFSGLTAVLYPWFEWKGSGYSYTVDNGLGPQFAAFALLGTAFFVLRRRLFGSAADRRVKWVTAGFIACGVGMFFTVLHQHPRYSLPLWIVMLAASAPLADLLIRRTPRGATALTCAALSLSAAMIVLHPAKVLMSRLRDGDLSRARAYEMPALFDELPEGTVVLNLGSHVMNYPLLGAQRSNRVVDTLRVKSLRERDLLRLPLESDQLDALGVDVVYTLGAEPPPFETDIVYETIFDDVDDPQRPASSAPTRVYRITRPQVALQGAP